MKMFNGRWGVHINREIETNFAHRNYVLEYGPRRNRLAHSLLFEEFEIVCENWMDLEDEFKTKGMLFRKFWGYFNIFYV